MVAFVHPQTGQSVWYLLPIMNTVAFQAALDNFATEVLKPKKAGNSKRVLIVLDRAPWHTAKDLRIPEGIEFVFQPSYSPEVQPSEHLWPLVDEAIHNRCFSDLPTLEQHLSDHCVSLINDPQRIRHHTYFHWWPEF